MHPVASAYPVEPAGAKRWLAGQEPYSDADLLDSAVESSPILYVARVHRRGDLRRIWATIRAAAGVRMVIFRSRCPGLLRFAARCGAVVTCREDDGAARVAISGAAFAAGFNRFKRAFSCQACQA